MKPSSTAWSHGMGSASWPWMIAQLPQVVARPAVDDPDVPSAPAASRGDDAAASPRSDSARRSPGLRAGQCTLVRRLVRLWSGLALAPAWRSASRTAGIGAGVDGR